MSGSAAHDLFNAVMGRTLSMTLVRSPAPVLLDLSVLSPLQHHRGFLALVVLKPGSSYSKMSKPCTRKVDETPKAWGPEATLVLTHTQAVTSKNRGAPKMVLSPEFCYDGLVGIDPYGQGSSTA